MCESHFDWPDCVRCVCVQGDEDACATVRGRLAPWGIDDRMQLTLPDPGWVEPRLRVALTHRRALEEASALGARHLLVIEPEVLLRRDAAASLRGLAGELASRDWGIVYLGAATWGEEVRRVPRCRFLASAAKFSGTHAILYSQAIMERLLDEMPAEAPRMGDWIAEYDSYDQYLMTLPDRLLIQPALASLPHLLPYEDPMLRESFVTSP